MMTITVPTASVGRLNWTPGRRGALLGYDGRGLRVRTERTTGAARARDDRFPPRERTRSPRHRRAA